jgi:hypothetical protein
MSKPFEEILLPFVCVEFVLQVFRKEKGFDFEPQMPHTRGENCLYVRTADLFATRGQIAALTQSVVAQCVGIIVACSIAESTAKFLLICQYEAAPRYAERGSLASLTETIQHPPFSASRPCICKLAAQEARQHG